jgi:RNA recognition motif-containing protein
MAVNVYVPKDRVTNLHQGYGFVEFRSEEDADYVRTLINFPLKPEDYDALRLGKRQT